MSTLNADDIRLGSVDFCPLAISLSCTAMDSTVRAITTALAKVKALPSSNNLDLSLEPAHFAMI